MGLIVVALLASAAAIAPVLYCFSYIGLVVPDRDAMVALAVALFGYLAQARDLPERKTLEGELVAPHTTDGFKIAVIEAWRRSGWPQNEFARRLGVDEKEARRILDPDRATKMPRLEQALSVLGQRVRVAVEPA